MLVQQVSFNHEFLKLMQIGIVNFEIFYDPTRTHLKAQPDRKDRLPSYFRILSQYLNKYIQTF